MIPAPLLNRHTAVAVVAGVALVVVVAVAETLLPGVAGVAIARRVVVALFAAVVALAVFLVWRTLARHSASVAGAALAAIAGLLLVALHQVVAIPVVAGWDAPAVLVALDVALALAALLVLAGFLGLGAAVLARRAWAGVTSVTLLVAGGLVAVLAALRLLGIPGVLPFAAWALVLLGLAVGLRTPRSVPDVGVPDTQLGAAQV